MTITLAELQERKTSYGLQLRAEYQKLEALQDSVHRVEALLMQITMLEIAEEHPTIEAWSFDANYEYDDEGSYFWCANFKAEGEHFKAETEEYEDWEVGEPVREIATEKSTALAFGTQEFEGSITVAELREALLT